MHTHMFVYILVYVLTHIFMRVIFLLAALGTNFARYGFAVQSSYLNSVAQRAIDGKTDGNFYHRSCTLTNKEHGPWWTVYFKNIISVRTVVIHNRNDCCGK